MKCTKETKTIGNYELVRTISPIRGIVKWTGDGSLFEGLRAHMTFNTWTDELFKEFMPNDLKTAYMDAWATVVDEMDTGKVVDNKIIDADGFIRCKMHQDDNETWIKFYRKETEEG